MKRWVPLGAASVALIACLVTQWAPTPADPPDFFIFWTAAWLEGGDPYRAVAAIGGPYPFYYPGPALIVLAPFALLPYRLAWVSFAVLSGGALGWAAMRYERGLAIACLSASFFEGIAEGQWSPLLVAAAVLPILGPVFAAKPSIGVALWIWRPHRWAVVGGIAMTALSLLLLPTWPRDWLASLHATNHVAPVLRPGGVLLLLALLRWRTPEARLLIVLSCVPQTTALYETLPLFLLPRHRLEAYGLALLTYVTAFIQAWLVPDVGPVETMLAMRWPVVFVLVWLPALALVLRPPTRSD